MNDIGTPVAWLGLTQATVNWFFGMGKVQQNIFFHHLGSCVDGPLSGDDQRDKESKIEEIIDLMSQFPIFSEFLHWHPPGVEES